MDGVCWRVVLTCMLNGWGVLEGGTHVYVEWGVLEGGTHVYVEWMGCAGGWYSRVC